MTVCFHSLCSERRSVHSVNILYMSDLHLRCVVQLARGFIGLGNVRPAQPLKL